MRPNPRHALNTMRYSEPEIERVARVAFTLARNAGAACFLSTRRMFWSARGFGARL